MRTAGPKALRQISLWLQDYFSEVEVTWYLHFLNGEHKIIIIIVACHVPDFVDTITVHVSNSPVSRTFKQIIFYQVNTIDLPKRACICCESDRSSTVDRGRQWKVPTGTFAWARWSFEKCTPCNDATIQVKSNFSRSKYSNAQYSRICFSVLQQQHPRYGLIVNISDIRRVICRWRERDDWSNQAIKGLHRQLCEFHSSRVSNARIYW